MSIEEQLRDKLEKVEAQYFGAGTTGEKNAAEAAIERLRTKLAQNSQQDPPVEMQFSMPDPRAVRLQFQSREFWITEFKAMRSFQEVGDR